MSTDKYAKRKKIFQLILANPEHQVSRREIRDNLERTYPRNGEKYVDAIIGRLLASGAMRRIKPGLYRPGSGNRRVKEVTNPDQLSILDAIQTQESTIQMETTIDTAEALFEQIGPFVSKTFPDAGPTEHFLKLQREAAEAAAQPDEIEEYADCLTCLMGAAYKQGFSWEEILLATTRKLEKNKKRKWKKLPDGTYQHVKQ